MHLAVHSVRMLESHQKLVLLGVDLWEEHARRGTTYLKTFGRLPGQFANEETAPAWHQRAVEALRPYGERSILFCESSEENAVRWPDESFDFVYIDGDHSYAGFSADLKMWWPKVKQGGFLAGHDYEWPDIAKALGEFFPDGVRCNNAARETGKCWLREKLYKEWWE